MDKTGEIHKKNQDELDTKLTFCRANVKKIEGIFVDLHVKHRLLDSHHAGIPDVPFHPFFRLFCCRNLKATGHSVQSFHDFSNALVRT